MKDAIEGDKCNGWSWLSAEKGHSDGWRAQGSMNAKNGDCDEKRGAELKTLGYDGR